MLGSVPSREQRAPVEAVAGERSEEIAVVYNGRVCLGHYVEQAGSWLASDGDHHQVFGTYPTRKAAIDAILDCTVRAG